MSLSRVAVTRPLTDQDPLVAALSVRGVESRAFPLLRIVGLTDPDDAARQIGSPASHDLVTFTSRNAVLGLEALLVGPPQNRSGELELGGTGASADSSGRLSGFLEPLSIAAVGEGTAGALRERGALVDVVPEQGNAEVLVEAIGRHRKIEGCRVLVPCGDRARRTVPERLRQGGALVTEVVVYHTVDCDPSSGELLERALRSGEVSVVTFASGSAVDAFVGAIGQERASNVLSRARIACLGRSAEEALRPLGIFETQVASASSFASLAEAAERLLRSED